MKTSANELWRTFEDHPVRAGLVKRAEDYCWSSAANRAKSAETSLSLVSALQT